jgi:hypothetical protein
MRNSREHWEQIQRPILEKLRFEGCTHNTYNPEKDAIMGCFLEWRCSTHAVYFDIEGCESFDKLEYICVEIVDLGTYQCHGNPGAEGIVATANDMKEICSLLEKGEIQDAKNLLMAWDVLNGKVARKEIAKLHEPQNWNKVENRPRTEEEKQRYYQAYSEEWAEIDRKCNPVIEAVLSHLETDLETHH